MDDAAVAYAVEPRYPICPACQANLFIPAQHDGRILCPDCCTELRLAAADVSDAPTAYYVSTVRRRKRAKPPPRIDGPRDIHRLLRPLVADADREMFYAVLLSTKNHVLEICLVSVGSLSASIVHPREILKPAIRKSAAALVVAHNHPSGLPDPSPEDVEFTRRLVRCGELLGIRLLDHVIVAGDAFVSLKEAGHLDG